MKDQKAILFFLLKFIGLYIVLNTAYGLWVEHYNPLPDPLTTIVSRQSAALISLAEDNISLKENLDSPYVPIQQDGVRIISVFEGCNSLNVMIVFVSFIVAFTGTWRKSVIFG